MRCRFPVFARRFTVCIPIRFIVKKDNDTADINKARIPTNEKRIDAVQISVCGLDARDWKTFYCGYHLRIGRKSEMKLLNVT